MYPWEFTERVSNIDQDVALVFGEEGKGLSTDDLLRCDYLVTLPTWEGYPITNLSHAVHTLTRMNCIALESSKIKVWTRRFLTSFLSSGISPEQRKVLEKSNRRYCSILTWR